MFVRIASLLRRFAFLALSLVLLTTAASAHASCEEFLFSSSSLNEQTYDDFFTHPALTPANPDLIELLRELKVTRVRWGSQFKVKGGWFRRSDRILVVKRPSAATPKNNSRYVIELAQALFAEKQRQLRFAGPVKYTSEMQSLSQRLEAIVLTTDPGLTPPKFNYVTYGLRSLLGFGAGVKKQWPATKPRLAYHWTLTRAFAGLLIATMAMNVSELPQAIETFETVWEMRDLMGGVIEEVTNSELNFAQDRLDVIASYEARILALEGEIENADPADVEFIKERIATFKVMIETLRADLANAPPT